MGTDHWRRVQEVFEKAAELEEPDRPAFLVSACGDDERLLAEVESLLIHHAGADDVLDRSAVKVVPGQIAEGTRVALVGQQIGRYTIRSIIGSGGQSVVYLAEQATPARMVALKCIMADAVSRSALRRFDFESQVLARLSHEHIAQIFEAGTRDDDGVTIPFFAMEYVPGARSIIEYADEKGLGTRERLELFIPICDAIHHGHRMGVIHRDLKPGNILVSPDGEPKVIDFGVARATDLDVVMTTLRTDVGELVGTLQYMSPEQYRADPGAIDTRSDVYSLGVVLYELLCGQLPHDVKRLSLPEAARVVCEESPSRPSSVSRALRGDVETIILKALDKDRERRYESAAELKHDIRRYLAGEPIHARPPSTIYQVTMFARRNKPLVGALAAVFVSLIAGLVVSLVFYAQARQREIELDEGTRLPRALPGLFMSLRLERFRVFTTVRLPEEVRSRYGGAPNLMLCDIVRPAPAPPFGELIAFDDEGTPVHRENLVLDVPPFVNSRDYEPVRSLARGGVVADIRRELPGDELVIAQCHPFFSPSAVCIYDLKRTMLARAWNDGHVQDFHWSSRDRLAVLVARSNNLVRTLPELAGFHRLLAIQESNPTVVMAIPVDDVPPGDSAIFPLRPTGEVAELRPAWMIVRKRTSESMDAEIRAHRSTCVYRFLPPDPGFPGAMCRIVLETFPVDEYEEKSSVEHFRGHLSSTGRVLEKFADENGQLYSTATGLPEPEFMLLDVDALVPANACLDDLLDIMTLDEAVAAIRDDESLAPRIRDLALEIVELRRGEPGWLSERAWALLRDDGLSQREYERAFEYADRSFEVSGDERVILARRGIAHYRLGDMRKACDDLLASNVAKADEAPTIAFLAMSLYRLGEVERASEELERLRRLMEDIPRLGEDPDAPWCLEEAEALIESGASAGLDEEGDRPSAGLTPLFASLSCSVVPPGQSG